MNYIPLYQVIPPYIVTDETNFIGILGHKLYGEHDFDLKQPIHRIFKFIKIISSFKLKDMFHSLIFFIHFE